MSYLEKMLELGEELRGKPGLFHVAVYHDCWCAIFNSGSCTCEPDVEMAKDEGEMSQPKDANDH